MFESLALEAAGPNQKRASNAKHLPRELGGENSWRILLGGMLTDIAVEHYAWASGGGQHDPDPTMAADRTALFLQRLRMLIGEGQVLQIPETYTGQVLLFLKSTTTVQCGSFVQTVGLGALSDPDVRNLTGFALKKARK